MLLKGTINVAKRDDRDVAASFARKRNLKKEGDNRLGPSSISAVGFVWLYVLCVFWCALRNRDMLDNVLCNGY